MSCWGSSLWGPRGVEGSNSTASEIFLSLEWEILEQMPVNVVMSADGESYKKEGSDI